MEPLTTAAIIGGGMAAGGQVLSSAFNAFQASKNRDFQERMSSTAHQREVADLRAAGLNPILSANRGGAATPSGSSAQATSGDIVGGALAAAQLRSQIKVQEAQANNLNSAAALNEAQTKTVSGTLPLQLNKMNEEIKDIAAAAGVKTAQLGEIEARINHFKALISNLDQQTQTEKVRLQKEKAISSLYKGLEDVVKYMDPKVRRAIKSSMDTFLKFKEKFEFEGSSAKEFYGH